LAGVVLFASGNAGGVTTGHDWTRFGWDARRSNDDPNATGITAANVGSLHRQQVRLPGTVDSSAIYLHGVTIRGGTHDAFFVTTTYGITLAIDASSGQIQWRRTPPRYSSWAGSAQITTATPVADPSREWIYAPPPLWRRAAASSSSRRVTRRGTAAPTGATRCWSCRRGRG